ncbi:MAG: LysR family transcriptional regulator [Actinomycetota bacterium]|nr:LysR family transcriptional regulator [Actinomycetota bacterium]
MKDLTLKQLHFLAATARSGSLAGAAASMHVTAPAIAQQLRLLERFIGLTLIERGPAGQYATQAGQVLLEATARIDAELAACAEELAAIRFARTGKVTIGAVSTAKYFAPHVLGSFGRKHPDVTVALSIGNRIDVLNKLENYDIDLAIMGRPPARLEVEQEVVGDHPYVIIAAPHHRLVGVSKVPFAQVAAESFLIREEGSGTRLHLDSLFSKAELPTNVGMEISSNETIKQAVMAGMGVALISAHTIAAEVHDGRLAVLDVAGLPIMRHWLVVRMARKSTSPATALLWDFFVTQASGQLPKI